jgi:plastocyanin
MRGRRIVVAVGALALLLAACGGDDDGNGGGAEECPDLTGGETFTITLSDNEYDPACARVTRMQGLTLENTGSNSHTFTLDGTSIDVEVAGGDTQNLEPPGEVLAAGTYTVYCRFHGSADGSGMSMELRVS